jgi:hypothetical protein
MVVRSAGRPEVEFIAEIVASAPLDGEDQERRFRGGSTVVFDRNGVAKFVVYKNLNSVRRRKMQQAFLDDASASTALTNYTDKAPAMQLAAIHRGC